jgi:hypothetical protein
MFVSVYQHLPNTNMCVGGASITSSPRPPPQNMCNSEPWPMLPNWGPPLSLMAPCVCTCVYVCVSEAANGSMPPLGINCHDACGIVMSAPLLYASAHHPTPPHHQQATPPRHYYLWGGACTHTQHMAQCSA